MPSKSPLKKEEKRKHKRLDPDTRRLKSIKRKRDLPRLGTPLKVKGTKNCLSCALYHKCKDDRKSFSFRCDKYSRISTHPPEEKTTRKIKTWAVSGEKRLADAKIRLNPSLGEENVAKQADINGIIKQIQDGKYVLPPDIRIDDRDVPQAKNFMDWCVGERFLNTKPFAKQIQIGINLFSEFCPICSKPGYAENIPLKASYDKIRENIVFLENGVCNKCRGQRSKFINKGKLGNYQVLAGLAGQRAGKDTVTSMIATYANHKWLKLSNPTSVFGMLPNTTLYDTFVALTLDQAVKATWRPVLSFIMDSPWYKEYHALLDFYGDKFGEELYRVRDTYYHYRHRSIYGSVSSPNRFTLRGLTRKFGTITEIGLFDSEMQKQDKTRGAASEVYTSILNSFETVNGGYEDLLEQNHNNIPQPIFVNISSPMSKFDKMVQLVEESKENKSIYAFHYCVAGDTLIQTENGIKRIDSLGNNKSINSKEIDFGIASRHGVEKATNWHFTGEKTIIKIDVKSGHQLKVSQDHKILIYRYGKYHWVETRDLNIGDMVCIPNHEYTRKEALKFNLTPFEKIKYSSRRPDLIKTAKCPFEMTPNLAYYLGALVAEGYLNKTKRSQGVVISNNDYRYLNTLDSIAKKVFNVKSKRYLLAKEGNGKTIIINGKEARLNFDMHVHRISSLAVVKWLEELGITKVLAPKKTIPWSIMEADEKSQLAFIAAYIEGDGWISDESKRIGIASSSIKLLRQIQIMLSSHGIMTLIALDKRSLITASIKDAVKFIKKIRPFMSFKKMTLHKLPKQIARNHGIPFDYIRFFFQSRKVRHYKTECLTDDGKIITLTCSKHNKCSVFNNNMRKWLSYEEYDRGLYDDLLEDLKRISPSRHEQFIKDINNRYWYSPVIKMKNTGKQKTYDLTINNKTPAFVANGIIIHNSTWEMNPKLTYERLLRTHGSNMKDFWRDFGAVPPMSENALISDIEHLRGNINSQQKNAFDIEPIKKKSEGGKSMMSGKIKYNWKSNSLKRCLCLDAGQVKNSFAGALGHIDDDTNMVIIDALWEVQPTEGRGINYNSLYEKVLIPIVEEYGVTHVFADRWQSIKLLHDLEADCGVETGVRSVKYDEIKTFRDELVDNRINLPKTEIKFKHIEGAGGKSYPEGFFMAPVAHFIFQCLTVMDNGKAVIKGPTTTDDIFRAAALLHTILLDPEYEGMFVGKHQVASSNSRGSLVSLGGFAGSANLRIPGGASVSAGSASTGGGSMAGYARVSR